MATPAHHLFKVVVVGNSGAGKSAITDRFTKNKFHQEFNPSIITFASKIIQIDGEYIKFQVWDTSGQDKYRKAIRLNYRDVNAVIFVVGFQKLNAQSPIAGETLDQFKKRAKSEIDIWFTEIKNYKPNNTVIFFTLNQADVIEKALSEKEIIAIQQELLGYAKQKAKDIIMTGLQEHIFLVSAKKHNGINELFSNVGQVLLERAGVELPPNPHIDYEVKDASGVEPGDTKKLRVDKQRSFIADNFFKNHFIFLMLIVVITAAVMLCVLFPPAGLAAMIPTVAATVGLGGVSTSVLALFAGATTIAIGILIYGLTNFAFGGKMVKAKSVAKSSKMADEQEFLMSTDASLSDTPVQHPAAEAVGSSAAFRPLLTPTVPPMTGVASGQSPASELTPGLRYEL